MRRLLETVLTCQAFDLEGLRRELQHRRKYVPVAEAIYTYISVSAAERDMIVASRALHRLAQVDQTLEEPDRGEIGGALFTQAVIVYCRAIDPNTRGRERVEISPAFTPEQQILHKAIRDLRGSVIAHHGRNEGFLAERWRRQTALLHEIDGAFVSVTDDASQPSYLGMVARELHGLVETALPYLATERTASARIVFEKIVPLIAKDKTFENLVRRFPFDPEAFYRGNDALAAFAVAQGTGFTIVGR